MSEENSYEEFQKSIKDTHNPNGRVYKNKVASKVARLSIIILSLGIVVGLLIGGITFAIFHNLLIVLQFSIPIIILAVIFYILLEGLSEIIELLQGIKDK